jgi:flagellar basal body-associated protein FliL
MAKTEKDVKEKEINKKESKQAQDEHTDSMPKTSLITWLILAAVIIAGSTGGFALSQLIGSPAMGSDDGQQNTEQGGDPIEEILASDGAGNSSWLFENIEAVLANLDEPGVSRFVRVVVTLEMAPELDQEKGRAYLTEKQVVLRDWMTTYFAGLSLEDVRGSRNHTRIKEEVQSQFNEILFPNSRPYVQRVLFKEFAVQ